MPVLAQLPRPPPLREIWERDGAREEEKWKRCPLTGGSHGGEQLGVKEAIEDEEMMGGGDEEDVGGRAALWNSHCCCC